MSHDEWSNDMDPAFYDDELPENDELDEDEDTDTVPCPNCGEDVYEDAEYCPSCNTYITPTLNSSMADRSLWWIVLGMAGIVATLIALTGFFSV